MNLLREADPEAIGCLATHAAVLRERLGAAYDGVHRAIESYEFEEALLSRENLAPDQAG
ncbi:MAG: hypothetical protein JWQ88_1066 [Rhodoferax sp.]|nr:hypothetical protein [Rhodoferax sp.]